VFNRNPTHNNLYRRRRSEADLDQIRIGREIFDRVDEVLARVHKPGLIVCCSRDAEGNQPGSDRDWSEVFFNLTQLTPAPDLQQPLFAERKEDEILRLYNGVRGSQKRIFGPR